MGVDDLASVRVGAGRGVEAGGAVGKVEELSSGVWEAANLGADVVDVFVEQGLSVVAGAFAAVFELEDGLDLGEGESGGLAVADEPQAFE